MKLIKLTKGKFVKVDNKDFEWLNQYKWFYCKTAKRAIGPHGKQKQIQMYNFIMNPPDGMVVDHINRDRLDNRRCNLRICTPQENQRNKGIMKNNKFGLKGVCKASGNYFRHKPWRVFIQGKLIGYFKTKEEAGLAYNKKARQLFGEFAKLNTL